MQHKTLRFGKGWRVHFGDKHSQAAEMVLAPGDKEGGPDNSHRGSDQWLFVISGKGWARVGRKRVRLAKGSLLCITRGEEHEIHNDGNTLLRTLNIYVPRAYNRKGDPLPRGKSSKR